MHTERIELTPAEVEHIRRIARDRNDPKQEAGVFDQRVDSHHSSYEIHLVGYGGEFAVAKALGIKTQHMPGATIGDGGVDDLNYRGYTIQVKTRRQKNWGFMCFKHKPLVADIGVLVWAQHENSYVIQG